MESNIYLLAEQINESLNSSKEISLLNKLEKEMNDSYEVNLLSNKKDEELEAYVSLKEAFGEEDERTINQLLKAKAAKEELYNHPLVKEYLSIYKDVRETYQKINDIIMRL